MRWRHLENSQSKVEIHVERSQMDQAAEELHKAIEIMIVSNILHKNSVLDQAMVRLRSVKAFLDISRGYRSL
jgi:hypothetical protein